MCFEFELPLDEPSVVRICYDGESYATCGGSPERELLNAKLDPFGH